ncbi:MAG: alpha/beta hydrolase [Calditrichaeota bacterium]|nr:MAG: alpha/beta hydrolase [Calditrichota bacterium]MBL1207757.1 alpha/beta hydrolase [Calditrichota bacterium]NOG47591.1 alpha/beta hydrolase [Calditrichota bacterium]
MISETAGKFHASQSSGEVSSILVLPDNPICLFLLAHGAGAPMNHSHMKNIAFSLAEENIATFRFNFPYAENSKRGIDPRPIILKTIESANEAAQKATPELPMFAGGHSFGGRMTTTLVSNGGLKNIKGIGLYSFPLHPPGKNSIERADHLKSINIPMLFLSGTRDKLAEINLLKGVCNELRDITTLHLIDTADHSFKILKRKRTNAENVYSEAAFNVRKWVISIL